MAERRRYTSESHALPSTRLPTAQPRRMEETGSPYGVLGNQSTLRLLGAGLQRKVDPGAAEFDFQGPLLLDHVQGDVAPGQMARQPFLEQLKSAVTATANATLGPLWTATGCPYIERWFAEHADSDAATLERLARRYAGAGATSASQLIYGICARLRGSIAAWRDGGDVNSEIADAGLSLATPAPEGEGGAQAKRAPDHGAPLGGPASLGSGSPLEAGAAGRIGGALGADVHGVRIHADAAATRSAASQGALAYTVGNHIVFGQGRYQPGTPVGDALLAHELAHVVQQRGGGGAMQPLSMDDDNAPAEHEADHAALSALSILYGDPTARSTAGQLRLNTGGGLRLQRCKTKKDAAPPPTKISEMDATQLKAITDAPTTHSFGEVAAATARAMMLQHQAAIAAGGQGLYQGNKCSTPAPPGVTQTDCTEYVLSVVGGALKARGKGADWENIMRTARAASGANLKGIEVLKAIQSQAGWTGVFWGPDPRSPADSLPEHPDAYRKVREKGTYYGVDVDKDKSVVEYRRTDAAKPAQTAQLEKLRKVPFGIIAAKGGYHMTVLINGVVYEVHWDKPANDPDVIQATPLESWPGWQSGVILMPSEDVAAAWKD